MCVRVYYTRVLKSKYPDEYSIVDKVGCEKNIIAEEPCFVVYCYVSQNTGAITGTLRLNRFDFADSLCCMQ